MTKTKKTSVLFLVGGMVLSGFLVAYFMSSNERSSQDALDTLTAQRDASNVALAVARDEVLALETKIEEQVTDIASLQTKLSEKELASHSLLEQIEINKKKHTQETKVLNDKVAALETNVSALEQRIIDTDKLYEQRYALTKQVGDLNEDILKASHKAELSKTACDEFKQGNSWNWVSEADCDKFNKWRQEGQQLIVEFENKNRALDSVNRQIASFRAPQE
ncbi:hypothetical protein LRP49_01270 [Enterovibrio sp. ZSDZ35]|uniref:Chromosome segregation ATPase n=1 Tax=Enterovibrio qingdaonensis TaxID=2899818 RepID=A0ABT5QFR5_9GAMM|nr:hypothetical protein [Enterovibrio sp. ZSDZ35]MDD1779813.1 hypothetical protein [Enterovibrio sp. ZSDZ35]